MRTLTLRREPLAELTRSELGEVAGGEITVTCWCIVQIVVRDAMAAVTELAPTSHCASQPCA